ncbi:unnamed protein product [Ranitomeya imitator]|uniref:Saccharopine dehydrogenase-like C-terminal domain-containing protein n=1 Tax=Ranitomeya imitator TaxID=111125 RepID=A0ABN9LX60_9NEOB|nr:unnamed protein product [Ranitomeya imitator]
MTLRYYRKFQIFSPRDRYIILRQQLTLNSVEFERFHVPERRIPSLRGAVMGSERNPVTGSLNAKTESRGHYESREAGYVATPIAMVQAGMTILKEPESLPKSGGVYTPGAAFSKTKLIDRLNKAGIHFTVLSKME